MTVKIICGKTGFYKNGAVTIGFRFLHVVNRYRRDEFERTRRSILGESDISVNPHRTMVATHVTLTVLALVAGVTLAQREGLDLRLNKEVESPGAYDHFGHMTCRAVGNAVELDSVTIFQVKVTGQTIALLTVSRESPQSEGRHDGVSVKGTLERNTALLVLDGTDAAGSDSSYILCEAAFTTPSGKKERAIATAWPQQPQNAAPGQASSDNTQALEAAEQRLTDLTQQFQTLNLSYQELLTSKKAEQEEQKKIIDRLTKLEEEASSPAPTQAPCDCDNITRQLENLDSRLTQLESEESLEEEPTVCERGMNTLTSKPYVTINEESMGRKISCDAQTDGGGWIVIQRHSSGDVNFYRTWTEYRNGFGDVTGDFWLGNEAISQLTNQHYYELRVDLTSKDGDSYASYDAFRVATEYENYRLTVGKYSGSVGESSNRGMTYHDGSAFSTYDKDNDRLGSVNCAQVCHGAWWYKDCGTVNINGVWGASGSTGMSWNNGRKFPVTFSEMKIRRID